MVIVAYNEAVDADVMEALERSGMKNYTKIKGVFGRGTTSGIHMGDDIWPGRNNILYIACSETEAKKLISSIRELRKSLAREGVKAFCLPMEEIT